MNVVHSWIKEYLGKETPSPEEVERLLTFYAFEIEGVETVGEETVIDVDVLPNRSSDCLSHRGIARELASLLDVPLTHDPLQNEITLPKTDALTVKIEDQNACRRFGLALMTDVTVEESPEWLSRRLETLGQRSINNVVDATNYVMLALGQPLHAYDADAFSKDGEVWRFGIRSAREEERITTLTGDEYELDPRVQLIVNEKDNAPAGIAGIKGGAYAEVTTQTKNIILEAGNFDPTITRRSAQFLRLHTDASKRFENEPSRELVPYALEEVTKLIADIAGGKIEGWADTYPMKQESVTVTVNEKRVNALLGLSLSKVNVKGILVRIGADVEEMEEDFTVTGPWERTDLVIEEDFIEEIGRVYGYEHVESVVPDTVPLTELNKRQYYSEKIRSCLIARGFSEVVTSSFRKKDEIELANALASDKGYLRSDLQKNIAETLTKNIPLVDLLGIPEVRVFEIGTVFRKGDGVIEEHVSLSLGVQSKQSGYTPKDDDVLKEAIAGIEDVLGGKLDAVVEKGVVEIQFLELLEKLPEPTAYDVHKVSSEIQYKPFSPYPFISRDIALWVDDGVSAADVERVLNNAAGELRARTTLFDEFTKDGRTSYAFRLVFQSKEKTLTDEEVNVVMDQVYQSVSERGWEVR